MQVAPSIEGENNRIRILEYMVGKEVTSGELQEALNLSKYQVDHFIKVLRNSRHIYRERINGCTYKYGRTSVKYKPKDFSKSTKKPIQARKPSMLAEDIAEIKPTSPHARVIRLLKNPLDPAPKRKGGHMYSGIRSGLGLFDGV
jgi:predicted transcriptional regulator